MPIKRPLSVGALSFLLGVILLGGCDSGREQPQTYRIQGKNNTIYLVNGPKGMTKKEVQDVVLRKYPEAAQPIAYIAPMPPLNFYGYSCVDDCSGHEAGYAWAEEQGIYDPDDCGGRSDSFIEGCRAYAEENGY